jgi:diadenosine tetraphosphate (Ap4A) HIT family hydrolase
VVYEDEAVVAFTDLNPITPGHLLVVPRKHAVGLEDLDGATSAHVWPVGHDMARALRCSSMRCEGINVFLCDGEAAFQTVLHFHLDVIPRYAGDSWTIVPQTAERERHSSTATRVRSRTPSRRRAELRPGRHMIGWIAGRRRSRG